MSDTIRKGLGPKAEAFLASGKGSDKRRKRQPKEKRNFRKLIDWQRADLSFRNPALTPTREKMAVTRYMAHRSDPSYRTLQAACSRVEPLS